MKLFIDGLIKKDGYFELPFDGYGFLGDERDQIIIAGDNLNANFEIAKTITDTIEDTRLVIYQTSDNFPYNTLGYITKFSCSDENYELLLVDFMDANKVKVLGTEVRSDKYVSRTFILQVLLFSKTDIVQLYLKSGNEYNMYEFCSDYVKKIENVSINSLKLNSLLDIRFLNIIEFEKIFNEMD